MKPNEIPLRLSLLNVTLKGLTFGAKNPNDLSDEEIFELYKKARKEVERPFDQLMKDAEEEFGENVKTLTNHQGYYAVYKEVPTNSLHFDESHSQLEEFRGTSVKRGELLVGFYRKHKDHPELRKSVDFISKHMEFFNKYVPIIVRKNGGSYEVVEGNHRVFAAIENGDELIPAIIETEDKPEDQLTSLDFGKI